jgi:hypothetical protein
MHENQSVRPRAYCGEKANDLTSDLCTLRYRRENKHEVTLHSALLIVLIVNNEEFCPQECL